MKRVGTHAIVVGGGMGGLFATAVASQFFDQVTVLDRDSEPTWGQHRKAIPQGRHFHLLLPGGLEAAERWFPGFSDDLVAAGSLPFELGRDFTAWTPLGRSYSAMSHVPEPFDGGHCYSQSRPVLESCVRQRVRHLANVTMRFGTLVRSPAVADRRVVGVTLDDGSTLAADLVIDASGRNGAAAKWMTAMGFGEVPESHINCGVNYATAVATPRDWDALEGMAMFVQSAPDGAHPGRAGTLVKSEDGTWLVGLGGRYDDVPPTDWEGFVAHGATLDWPIWSELVATVEPTDEIHSYHLPRAVRRHFEQLDEVPDGLLALGDTVCFFNPTYGQGMSSAAVQCRVLESALQRRSLEGGGVHGLGGEVYPEIAEWVRGPWALAAIGDFTHPNCSGDFPLDALDDLQRLGAAFGDEAAGSVVLDIAVLRAPLSAIRAVERIGAGA